MSSFYLFSILKLFVHPLDSFSFSGLCRRTSFLVKTIAQNVWCGFRFCAIVLSSSALAKKRSELNGCRKTLTFESPCFACVSGQPAGCTKISKSAIAPTCSRGPFRTVLGPMSCAGWRVQSHSWCTRNVCVSEGKVSLILGVLSARQISAQLVSLWMPSPTSTPACVKVSKI